MKLVYSKGDKFCCSTFAAGDSEQALAGGYKWISEKDYNALRNRTKCWENGVLVEYTKTATDLALDAEKAKRKRIAELKGNLGRTDYLAIKYAEGLLTEEEYAPNKAQRQLWRDKINELENEK